MRQILILLVGAAFAWHVPVVQSDSYYPPINPDLPSGNYSFSGRWVGPEIANYSYTERGLRFYRSQHQAIRTASGHGISYQLNELPFTSWLAERKIFQSGVAYNPRKIKVYLAIETKPWGYKHIQGNFARYSDSDLELAGSDITDRFYQILFNIPF